MKSGYIYSLVVAAALCLVALIGFQVSWMNHSRRLLEEQFNHRAMMALCSTVEKLATNESCADDLKACCKKSDEASCNNQLDAFLQKPETDSVLRAALSFHQINLPYRFLITSRDTTQANCSSTYSCSLEPILADDTRQLTLDFVGKNEYILRQMGAMIAASVAILLFICFILGLGAYYLFRQKNISDRNREFFNLMTHEFRTPLTNIRLAANMLTRKKPELLQDQYVGIIKEECGELTEQVENVLHLAALEKGDYRLSKELVDLSRLAGDVVAGMALQIKERGAGVRVEAPPSGCAVQGDPFHISNAFRNLLDNALKYNDKTPEVDIGFSEDTEGWRVSFSDNGVGLPTQRRKQIFQKFFRGMPEGTRHEKGFGLGLAYVDKIMKMHRGQVRAYSESGKGSRFELFFPV